MTWIKSLSIGLAYDIKSKMYYRFITHFSCTTNSNAPYKLCDEALLSEMKQPFLTFLDRKPFLKRSKMVCCNNQRDSFKNSDFAIFFIANVKRKFWMA